MAETEKITGELIDDEALDGVVGGRSSIYSTPRSGSAGTEEPLNSDTADIAEDFLQGINLGGLPKRS